MGTITGGTGGADLVKPGVGGGTVGNTKAAAGKVEGGVNGMTEGTEPTSPKTPKAMPPPKTMPLKSMPDKLMPPPSSVPDKSPGLGGAIMGGINGTVASTKAVAIKVAYLITGAEAFQQVYASIIDKSDEGLAASFEKVDADASGNISSNEMRNYLDSVYGGYAAPKPESSSVRRSNPVPSPPQLPGWRDPRT